MYTELRYEHGSLVDGSRHRWHRSQDWVEPDDARDLIKQGFTILVQYCGDRPRRTRPERFNRDIKPRLMTRSEADTASDRAKVSTVLTAELWKGEDNAPPLLLFVEGPPGPRDCEALADDW